MWYKVCTMRPYGWYMGYPTAGLYSVICRSPMDTFPSANAKQRSEHPPFYTLTGVQTTLVLHTYSFSRGQQKLPQLFMEKQKDFGCSFGCDWSIIPLLHWGNNSGYCQGNLGRAWVWNGLKKWTRVYWPGGPTRDLGMKRVLDCTTEQYTLQNVYHAVYGLYNEALWAPYPTACLSSVIRRSPMDTILNTPFLYTARCKRLHPATADHALCTSSPNRGQQRDGSSCSKILNAALDAIGV